LPRVDLSKREREVLERIARGASNETIAAELGIVPQTVRNYITTVYDKLGVHTRGEAIVWARERGIV
jgi:DNA-binding CsgD family transcriptional regulator